MNVLWSPPIDPSAARALARASELADMQQPVSLNESGLVGLLLPRRAGRNLPVAAACSALEILAVAQAPLAASLCAALMGCLPLLCLGTPRQRQAWLAPVAAGEAPAPLLVVPEGAGVLAAPRDGGWDLAGEGRCFGAAEGGALLVFASAPAARAQRLRAFAVQSGAGALVTSSASSISAYGWEPLHMDTSLPEDALLDGDAQGALAQALALHRILAAALSMGVCGAAFEHARQVAGAAPAAGTAGAEAASRLAGCAASLSAARLMLYEAARASSVGEDCTLLSAMTLLTAGECAERLIGATAQIAGGNPAADPTRLQALLSAHRIHQTLAGAAEPQRVLLAGALVPALAPSLVPAQALRTQKEVTRTMSRSTTRTADAAGRVGEILDAAADAFTQQSYDATTLDYIGDVIGVTKGSIYYHYRSKADLFVAVYRRAMELNIETVEPIARQAGVRAIDRLYRMAYAHALQVMKHLSYQRLAVQGLEAQLMGRVTEEQRSQLNEVIALRDHYEELFAGAVREAVEAGDLPQQNARLAVKPLFGAINWTTMWYQPREGETAADRARIATQLATFVVSGLTQSHQPAAMDAVQTEVA